MTRDWFRRTSWSPEIEEDFFRRLRRARPVSRRQYMYIQALTWMEADPRLAPQVLRLLERYPTDEEVGARPVFYDDARMCLLFVRSWARRWAGDLDGAVADHREMTAYLRAHERLGAFQDHLQFAELALAAERSDLVEEAYDLLLESARTRASPFPKHRFRHSLLAAQLAHRLGRASEASAHAQDALRDAMVTRTAMRNHPHLGLVQSLDPGVLDELRWLVDPSSRH